MVAILAMTTCKHDWTACGNRDTLSDAVTIILLCQLPIIKTVSATAKCDEFELTVGHVFRSNRTVSARCA